MSNFNQINKLIRGASTILTAGHETPDGDCMGSALAVVSILKRMGKNATLYRSGSYPFNLMFLKNSEAASTELPDFEPDLYFILDCGDPKRVGSALFEKMSKSKSKKILFDHHLQLENSERFYDAVYIDKNACAAAAIVFRWLSALRLKPNRDEAEAIYAAIISDTGNLRFANANSESFLILSELAKQVSPREIIANIYEKIPLNQLKLLAEVLNDMIFMADGRVAVMKITLKQFEKYGLTPDNVESFVNYPQSVEGVEIVFRFRETGENLWKVSARSRQNIDCAAIAAQFGGGGHKNAAGFNFIGAFDEGVKSVEKIAKSIKS